MKRFLLKKTKYNTLENDETESSSISTATTTSTLKRKSRFSRIFCLSAEDEDEEAVDDVVPIENLSPDDRSTGSGDITKQSCPNEISPSASNTKGNSLNKPRRILKSKVKKESIAWEFFQEYTTTHVKCKDCGKLLKFCRSTTSLVSHAETQHPVRYCAVKKNFEAQGEVGVGDEIESECSNLASTLDLTKDSGERTETVDNPASNFDKDDTNFQQAKTTTTSRFGGFIQPTINRLINKIAPYSKDSSKRKELDKLLALFICKTFQSLRIVESPEFQKFVLKLNPRYTLMSRKTLTYELLPRLYDLARDKLQNLLNNTNYIAITTDCWTSCSNQSFLGVTAHFWEKKQDVDLLQSRVLEIVPIPKDETADSLAALLQETFKSWKIESKICAIVTDHAPNMKLMVDKLKVRHLGCFAHTLNTVVKNCISGCRDPTIKSAIQKTKDIVTYFHHSAKGTRLLMEANQENLEEGELKPPKLKQYVETRWNTLRGMIESVVENLQGIEQVLLKVDKKKILTEDEVKILQEISKIMKPFQTATEMISGDQYVTLSAIIPCIKGIRLKLSKITVTSEPVKSLLSDFIQKVTDNLSVYETRTITRVATLIDPRFKKLGFIKDSNVTEAEKLVKGFLSKVITTASPSTPTVSSTVPPTLRGETGTEEEDDYLFSYLDVPANEAAIRTPTVDATTLLDSFYLLSRLDSKSKTDECIMNLKCKHPELYEVFMMFSAIPGSSVPCERLFSNSGYTMSDRRNRLSSRTLNMLVFLNKNCDLV